jgi:hypothetical protein
MESVPRMDTGTCRIMAFDIIKEPRMVKLALPGFDTGLAGFLTE